MEALPWLSTAETQQGLQPGPEAFPRLRPALTCLPGRRCSRWLPSVPAGNPTGGYPRHGRSAMRVQRRRRAVAATAALVIGGGVGAASVVTAGAAQAAGQLDNPYAGATVYVNPEWAANATA